MIQFLFIALYVLIAAIVTVHVLLTKSDVRAALGWVAVAWLSPFVGALLYFVFGINRVTRRALDFAKLEQQRGRATGPNAQPALPANIAALSAIGQRVTESSLIAGNTVSVLQGGDEAYPAMLAAIRNARHSVALASYIFRDDAVGRSFIEALIDAQKRGVAVRVLIDGIGSGYVLSMTLRDLKAGRVPAARFLHTWVPWRMPFLNMRNHKKLLIVDGTVGFTGGLNIGAEHSLQLAAKDYIDGVQVRVEGPITRQLMDTFARDWSFTTDEELGGNPWWPAVDFAGAVFASRAGRRRANTLKLSFGAIRLGGKISLIGGLSGAARELNPGLIFSKRANVQGISVGSMQTFETMNAAIAANNIKPVIDHMFGFDEVRAAYRHMEAGGHFGEIVVRVA